MDKIIILINMIPDEKEFKLCLANYVNYKNFLNEILKIPHKTLKEKDILPHSENTAYWCYVLYFEINKSIVPEFILLAALGHDLERAFSQKSNKKKAMTENEYLQYKLLHSIESAKITTEKLFKIGIDFDTAIHVSELIIRHEFGGTKESDILRDADCISFFDKNINNYLKRYGLYLCKAKSKYMYLHSSQKAKKIISDLFLGKSKDIKEYLLGQQ